MTESELQFEKLLGSYNYPYTKIPESRRVGEKRPDYLVGTQESPTYWEIKQLDENPDETDFLRRVENKEILVFSVNSDRINNTFRKACKQFKSYQVIDYPCVVVLNDARDFAVQDVLFHDKISSMIIGNAHLEEKEDGQLYEFYRTESVLLRKSLSYISGIAVMYGSNRMDFYHNPYTKNSMIGHDLLNKIDNQYVVNHTGLRLDWIKA